MCFQGTASLKYLFFSRWLIPRRCLTDYDIACCLRCVTSFEDSESVNKFVKTDGFQCTIGIHAWRAGRLLLGKSVSKLTQY